MLEGKKKISPCVAFERHVFFEGTGVFPVPEAFAVPIGPSAQGKNEGQQDQSEDGDDFEGGQPELDFSEGFDAEVIDDENRNEEDGDKHSGVDAVAINPFLDYQRCRRQLVGCDNDISVFPRVSTGLPSRRNAGKLHT
jgi:hypothetical protein